MFVWNLLSKKSEFVYALTQHIVDWLTAHQSLKRTNWRNTKILILALRQLAPITRPSVRSAHLALCQNSLRQYPAKIALNGISCEKMQMASSGTVISLISALVTTSSPRLKARAWCGDSCRDQPISPPQRCHMHIPVPGSRPTYCLTASPPRSHYH